MLISVHREETVKIYLNFIKQKNKTYNEKGLS